MRKTFVSDTGIQVPAVTASEMREVDRIAMEETGPNLYQMMENAGRNLASFAIECLGRNWKDAVVLVLAGPGGNGGGGICAARHLANHGLKVKLCLAEPEHLGEVPAYQRKIVQSTRAIEVDRRQIGESDLILDALLGYSLKGPPRGATGELIHWAASARSPIIALDIPSGVDATTGATPGESIRAQWTLTLALPKAGLRSDLTGKLILADIGIPQRVYERMDLAYRTPFDNRFRVPIQQLPRDTSSA